MSGTVTHIATAPAPESAFGGLLPWIGVLLGMVVVGAIVIAFTRRMLRDESGEAGAGFTLHDLRELHRRGELSDEEFRRAKDAMIGRLRGHDESDDAGEAESAPPNAR
jgi:uncharacterized membrane protein